MRRLLVLLKACGSVYFALGLMVVLTVVLVWATLIDMWYGEAAARFGIYGTWWFTTLGALLALNILAALLVRFPWNRRQLGFVVAHVGLLVLLTGCLISRRWGVEAMLSVYEHRSESRAIQDSQHFKLTVAAGEDEDDEDAEQPPQTILVPFRPGPFNWDTFDHLPWFPWHLGSRDQGVLYDRDGIRLEVLDYFSSAEFKMSQPKELQVTVTSATRGSTSAAAKPTRLNVLEADDPHARQRREALPSRRSLPGGQQLVCTMTISPEETAAFRQTKLDHPPGRHGTVVLRAGGRNYQWPLEGWKPGERRPFGKTGMEAELVQLKDGPAGVRLLIHDGNDPPQPLSLFADVPEHNQQDYRHEVFGSYWVDSQRAPEGEDEHDAMRRRVDRPRIDVLLGADQSLYLRAWRVGKLEPAVPLPTTGTKIAAFQGTPDAVSVAVEKFAPSEAADGVPSPLPYGRSNQRQALVELTIDGKSDQFWLGNPSQGAETQNLRRTVEGTGRRVSINLDQDALDLGVSVKLRKFQRRLEPGTMQPSHFSSRIDLLARSSDEKRPASDKKDKPQVLRENVPISMNSPLDFTDPRSRRSYRVFQSGYSPDVAQPPQALGLTPVDASEELIYASQLAVASDPGRMPKYLGCLLILLGIFLRYYVRLGSRRAEVGGAA